MFKLRLSVFLLLAATLSLPVLSLPTYANDLPSFIEESYVPVFDCPAADVIPIIDGYLDSSDISATQRRQLTVRKTHAQICMGKSPDAQAALQSLLADEKADRTAKYYTNAIYQYAFIYDQQENLEKCNYYRLARDTSKGKFSDIYSSATLAFITDCSKGVSLDQKMTDIYEVLEAVTKTNDKAAMAHAYNRVGLFYGFMGARQLAAIQYLKAYEVGKDIYTYENQVPLLTSAITALLLNDDLEKAEEVLDEFRTVMAKTESAFVQFNWLYSQAGFYIKSQDYKNLAIVVDDWTVYKQKYSNPISNGLYRWYSSALCLHNNDVQCLQTFVNEEKTAPQIYLSFVSKSKEYLLFKADVYIFLGDTDGARKALHTYADLIAFNQKQMQANARNIGSVNFYSKILNLESEVARQQTMRYSIIVGVSVVLFILVGLLFWFMRHKNFESKSFDSATGLLNSVAVVNKISNLPAPGAQRTNALAIFDIANFTEVNLSLGSGKSDYVLLKLANTFRQITRNSDLVGRFGPGQFILCLADIEEDAAQAFFERVKEALTNTFKNDNNGTPISVDSSMSIYYESGTFEDINEILDNMLLSLSIKSAS